MRKVRGSSKWRIVVGDAIEDVVEPPNMEDLGDAAEIKAARETYYKLSGNLDPNDYVRWRIQGSPDCGKPVILD